jgi:TolB-like protein/Tfp pilus assembly protein PilF
MKKLFEELKRRNVIKAALSYIVFSWVLIQAASILYPSFGWGQDAINTTLIILIIGFPVWLVFAFVFEWTHSGFKKTDDIQEEQSVSKATSKRLNGIIIAGLSLAVILLITDRIFKFTESDELDKSIAVLPFEDLTAEGDSKWFCLGVTEDILTHLSKINGLRVISRTSAMRYKDHEKSIPEIAKELGVSYVVEGSVRTQGDKVLVTAQLINTSDNHLWADNYNENLDDVFKIQQEISKKIVQQLKIVINPEKEEALISSSTSNVEAYQLFLKGRSIADSRTKENLEQSIEYYKHAISLDTNYADAYSEVALSTYLLWVYGGMPEKESIAESKKYINKALALNPNTSSAYNVLANISSLEQNFDLAQEYYEKAISINPNNATAHHHYSTYFRNKTVKVHNPKIYWEKSLIQINIAQQLDPISYPINQTKIIALLGNGKIDEAEALLNEKSYVFDSKNFLKQSAYINTLKNKDITEFFKAYLLALEKEPKNAQWHNDLAYYYRSILNDYESAVKHSKIAFEIDDVFVSEYFTYLCFNKQYDEAKSILENPSLMSSFSESEKQYHWFLYYSLKREYIKALHYTDYQWNINSYKISHYEDKAWLLSLMGEKEIVIDMLKSQGGTTSVRNKLYPYKAILFANLKLKDSMYYYIEKALNGRALAHNRLYELMKINGRFEFDPYRNEPRFKAYLKENYFPIPEE